MQACVWGLGVLPEDGSCAQVWVLCEPHAEPHIRFCVWLACREMTLCQHRAGWSSHLADRALMTASTGLCVPGTRATQGTAAEDRRCRKSQRSLGLISGTRSDLKPRSLGCRQPPPSGGFTFLPLFSLSGSLDETPGRDGGAAVVVCARLRCQGYHRVEATCLESTPVTVLGQPGWPDMKL